MEFIQKELKEIKELLKRQTIQQKKILTIDEAADFLGLSKSCLYKMTSSKKIPHCKPHGKKIYLDRQELEQWVLSSRVTLISESDDEIEDYLGRNNKNLAS